MARVERLAVAFSNACGEGEATHDPGTPAGTYSLTISATSGSLAHETTVNLTVQ